MTVTNNPRCILRWRLADGRFKRIGYYCSECNAYIGKQGRGQKFCPMCHRQVVGKYA